MKRGKKSGRSAGTTLAHATRYRALLGTLLALSIVGAVVVLAISVTGSRQPSIPTQPAAFSLEGPGQHFPSQGHCHIGINCPGPASQYANYPYDSNPPTSGPHIEKFPDAFILGQPLPKAILVHILEHGNVVILYNPHANKGLVDRLRAYVRAMDQPVWFLQTPQQPGADVGEQLEQAQALFVAPYPDMPHKIALVAWTRLDAFDTYNPQRVARFVRAWLGNSQNVSQ